MRLGTLAAAIGLALVAAEEARGQFPPRSPAPALPPTAARVETAPLALTPPDPYQIPAPLEPLRRVALMVATDGIVRMVAVPVGATVRDTQEIVQLDRAEAAARLKIARAGVNEMQAALADARSRAASAPAAVDMAAARVEAAQAQAELAQLDVDRCTLRAPFAGRVLAVPVAAGQYVAKGTTVAEVADVSSLRVLLPVDRTAVVVDAPLELTVEGKAVEGKVRAVLPLPETFAPLRDLAIPLAAAWVEIANRDGALEPGQRARSPWLPTAALAVVPDRAVRAGDDGARVQVIRTELVTNVPVVVLGEKGPERLQVSGPFRPNDALIVETSVPLAAGTLIRFEGDPNRPVETTGPRPGEVGGVVNITPPSGPPSGVAPIGSPAATAPRAAPRPSPSPARPAPEAPKPAPPPAGRPGSVVPF